MQKKKSSIVSSLTSGITGLCKKNKVDVYYGLGSFVNNTTININGQENKQITATNIIIATGSKPTPFPNIPFDEKIIVSSTGNMNSSKIPKDLIVVGGGVIGLELGSVYKRLGSEVTVVEFEDLVCKNSCDHEIAKKF